MNILYLEDNKTDAELFGVLLEKEVPGAEFKVVGSYDQYMRAINSQERFDLIICDHRIPGFNGLSAIDIAKRDRGGVPVIFITGVRKDLIPSAKWAGADYAVDKMGFTDLMVIIREQAKSLK